MTTLVSGRGVVALERPTAELVARLAARLHCTPEEAIHTALLAAERLADVNLDRNRAKQAGPKPHTGRFERDFAEAFAWLDQGINLVRLAELRRRLSGYERDTFDLALRDLCRRDLYVLSPSDRPVPMSDLNAAIWDDHRHMIFVSRRVR